MIYDRNKHILLLYSGGMGSFLAAYLLKQDGFKPTLYFNDTNSEDRDLYRFLDETVRFLNFPLIVDSDGRDIWEVFVDTKFLGNSRIDPCSRILKRERLNRFLKSNKINPDTTLIATGLSWDENDRIERAKARFTPFKIINPLADYWIDYNLFKKEVLEDTGIEEPYLYRIGMSHNNCAGFCVKAGLKHYRQLYLKDKERYLYFENKEQEIYQKVPNARPFLSKTKNKQKYYLSLKEYRLTILDKNVDDTDLDESLGCNACAI